MSFLHYDKSIGRSLQTTSGTAGEEGPSVTGKKRLIAKIAGKPGKLDRSDSMRPTSVRYICCCSVSSD